MTWARYHTGNCAWEHIHKKQSVKLKSEEQGIWNGDLSTLQPPWNNTHKRTKIPSGVIGQLFNFNWMKKYSVPGRKSGIKKNL